MSRGQAILSEPNGKTQLVTRCDDFHAVSESKVLCFDNIKLGKAGEYIVRGVVESELEAHFKEGFFEPGHEFSVQGAYDARFVAATSVVRMDERNLVPIRLFTLHDNVSLKKGFEIGSIWALEVKEKNSCENIRTLLINKEERWQVLQVKFAKHFSSMSESRKGKIIPLLHEYADIFSTSKSDIGLTGMVTHEIETGEEYPICTPYRRIPMALEEKVDDMVKEMEDKGIIRASVSPWNAPLHGGCSKKEWRHKIDSGLQKIKLHNQKTSFSHA